MEKKSTEPKSTHSWDWFSALLLLLMTQVSVSRLVVTQWTDFLFFTQTLASFGLFLGIVLGYSQFKRRAVIILALGYSSVIIPWQLAFVTKSSAGFSERITSIGGRLYFSLVQFSQSEPVDDWLLFVAFISIVAWFIGMASGYWWTRHRNYFVATLPGLIFALTIHFYDSGSSRRIGLIAAYILFSLILLGRLYYLENQKSWQNRKVFQMQGSSLDLTRGMAITAAIFIVVAWTIPASQAGLEPAIHTWRLITEPWRDFQEWLSYAVEGIDASSDKNIGDVYGSRLNLGTGNPRSRAIVFTVDAPALPEKYPRFYWRGYVYDTYRNGRWYSTDRFSDVFSPTNTELFLPNIDTRAHEIFIVKTNIPQSLLYTATQPIWVSRPGEIEYASTDSKERDLVAWKAEPELMPGEQYHVAAALANPSKQQLRSAGENYPDWVTKRYLQLPDDFSTRIRELAKEIIKDKTTPYDKANTITIYLRNEIEYTNPLSEAPPEGVNTLEWFLLDTKKGFCTYYATAEVLMLRSLGIPARMSAGFSEGEYDNVKNSYTIRNMNAHAWPEVYFPGIGWIEFEPTGNQAPLVRPDKPKEIDSTEGIGDLANPEIDENSLQDKLDEESGFSVIEEGESLPEEASKDPFLYIYLGLGIIFIIVLILINYKYRFADQIPIRLQAAYEQNGGQAPPWLQNWSSWVKLSPIERSFEMVNRSLKMLGKKLPLSATPAERAKMLTQTLPSASEAIETLTRQHERALFTPDDGNETDAQRASLIIWLYTIQSRIKRFRKRKNQNKLSRSFHER